jgi:CRISPR/Cas system Type II protein with McrA/HNH and RuvC-like nuclease domain
MNEYILRDTDRKPLAEEWLKHEFYRSAVVLGIDIGLEGIGLYLRRGPQEVFGRSVMVELPQAEALAGRRQKRGWRHCRKNRKRRLHRLKQLFQKHGLPWLDADRMSKAHPFRERYRAINNGVASKEALSICIRHCVVHRGYDYGGTEEGAFPWGDSPLLSKATEWLSTAYVTPDLKDDLERLAPQLLAGRNEAEQREQFVVRLSERLEWSAKNDIGKVLAEHNKGGHDNLRTRARGFNFPRRKIWEHLEAIIRRHAHLVEDVDGFIATLGLNPNEQPDAQSADNAKKRAIFFYNRKTRFDMERHWAKKVNTCPFAGKLGGNPDERCAENGDLNVRRWKMLEFAANRRFVEVDLTEGKGST